MHNPVDHAHLTAGIKSNDDADRIASFMQPGVFEHLGGIPMQRGAAR
jgi:hypothetical protein